MIHRIEPVVENLQGRLSREKKPILTIDSGDTLVAGTRTCIWGLEPPAAPGQVPPIIPQADRKDPENDLGNCLIGPIAVRGAKPGMGLEVEIEELAPISHGVTMIEDDARKRCERLGVREGSVMTWEFEEGFARNSSGLRVKLHPFLGHLGVTPGLPGYHSNLAPRSSGGNMDCRDLVVGSKIYLPIEVPEARFSFGDGHAAQGDGEVCGTAIECPMDPVRLTVRLIDEMPLKWPFAQTPSGLIAFGFGEDLDQATYIALNNMLDLMGHRLGVNRNEAALLASLVVDLHITQIVNPSVGVHAVWRDDFPPGIA